MPGLSGIQALGVVRSWGWSVPVVLITAFADEYTIADALRAGACAVLSKPFDLDELRTMLARVMPRRVVGDPARGRCLAGGEPASAAERVGPGFCPGCLESARPSGADVDVGGEGG